MSLVLVMVCPVSPVVRMAIECIESLAFIPMVGHFILPVFRSALLLLRASGLLPEMAAAPHGVVYWTYVRGQRRRLPRTLCPSVARHRRRRVVLLEICALSLDFYQA